MSESASLSNVCPHCGYMLLCENGICETECCPAAEITALPPAVSQDLRIVTGVDDGHVPSTTVGNTGGGLTFYEDGERVVLASHPDTLLDFDSALLPGQEGTWEIRLREHGIVLARGRVVLGEE